MELQTNLPTRTTEEKITFRAQALQSLAGFRQEWQHLMDGESLLAVQTPVGLILADVADKLGLSPQERIEFLGDSLAQEIDLFMKEQVKLTQ
jgi:hypothetical protein